MYGAIDIGSNSIRLGIYNLKNNKLNLVFKDKTTIGLASYIEEGKLTEEGINKTCEVLLEYKNTIKRFDVKETFAFATASLRKAENRESVINYINKSTGIHIAVISGKDEGILDFNGTIKPLKIDEGVLVDIGGGSTEVVTFKNKKIVDVFSMPIGSLDFYSRYVNLLFPTKEEAKVMEMEVLKEIKKAYFAKSDKFKTICGLGGSIKGLMLINESLNKNNKNTKEIMEAEKVNTLISELSIMNKESINKILKIVPSKIHTIIPGMVILNTIINFFEGEKIILSKSGVREGYLYSKIQD